MIPKAEGILADILANGIDVHRCAAARALAEIESQSALEALCKALLDEDSDVRTDAAEALGRLGNPAAAEALMANLTGDPDPDVKKAALSALIDFDHEPVVRLMRKLVVSRTEDIVWDEDEFYAEGWDSWVDLQLLAIRGLAKFGVSEAVPDILTAMADEMGQDVSEPGVAAMAHMGREGAESLEELFRITDPQLRRRIVAGVASAKNRHAASLIALALEDDNPRVREVAALALDASDPQLEPLFADPDASVRSGVVRHGGANFPEQVAALIADPEPQVRIEVFKTIAAHADLFGDKSHAAAVQKAIAGEPEAAHQAAVALVALRGPKAIKGLTHAMRNKELPLAFRLGAVRALQTAGPVAVPFLLRAVGDDERQMRLAVMTALAAFAADDPVWPNAAGEGLLAALAGSLVVPPEEPDAEVEENLDEPASAAPDPAAADEELKVDETLPLVAVREAAGSSTLDSILSAGADDQSTGASDPEPVELSAQDERFVELAKQRRMSKRKMSLESDVAPHLDVRRFAATLLGEVANTDVTATLIERLTDDDPELREAALNSIVRHGEKTGTLPADALAPLVEQMADTGSEIRVLVVRALAWVQGQAATDAVRGYIGDADPLVRVEAVRSLGHRGVADDAMAACLKDEYVGVGIAAAKALADNLGDDAAELLIGFAFDHDGAYRHDIGRILGASASDAGILRLIELLRDDTYLRHRLVVIDALAAALKERSFTEERQVA